MSKIQINVARHQPELRAKLADLTAQVVAAIDEIVDVVAMTPNTKEPALQEQDLEFYEKARVRWVKRQAWYDDEAVKAAKKAELERMLAELEG